MQEESGDALPSLEQTKVLEHEAPARQIAMKAAKAGSPEARREAI
jgi:hypothetical protein